jgi:hypothetical protein
VRTPALSRVTAGMMGIPRWVGPIGISFLDNVSGKGVGLHVDVASASDHAHSAQGHVLLGASRSRDQLNVLPDFSSGAVCDPRVGQSDELRRSQAYQCKTSTRAPYTSGFSGDAAAN